MLVDHEGKPLNPKSKGRVDESRRRFGRTAGLGGPAILATLASRPVLGATCLTPSAAGSGNLSQHNPGICAGLVDWTNVAPGQWPSGYGQNDKFHKYFTAGPYLNFNYQKNQNTIDSYTLSDVLKGNTPNAFVTDSAGIGKVFVNALLSAAHGNYGGVIQPIGPDPSVRGIEDEFARNGYFVPTAGKQWFADTIKAYLNDPGSVF